jgi:hypothetical protein
VAVGEQEAVRADVVELVQRQLDGLSATGSAALAQEAPRVPLHTETLGGALDVLVDFAQEALVAARRALHECTLSSRARENNGPNGLFSDTREARVRNSLRRRAPQTGNTRG